MGGRGQHRKTDRHMTEVDLGVASHSSDMKLAAQLLSGPFTLKRSHGPSHGLRSYATSSSVNGLVAERTVRSRSCRRFVRKSIEPCDTTV